MKLGGSIDLKCESVTYVQTYYMIPEGSDSNSLYISALWALSSLVIENFRPK